MGEAVSGVVKIVLEAIIIVRILSDLLVAG
jgi:hypothetical protein